MQIIEVGLTGKGIGEGIYKLFRKLMWQGRGVNGIFVTPDLNRVGSSFKEKTELDYKRAIEFLKLSYIESVKKISGFEKLHSAGKIRTARGTNLENYFFDYAKYSVELTSLADDFGQGIDFHKDENRKDPVELPVLFGACVLEVEKGWDIISKKIRIDLLNEEKKALEDYIHFIHEKDPDSVVRYLPVNGYRSPRCLYETRKSLYGGLLNRYNLGI